MDLRVAFIQGEMQLLSAANMRQPPIINRDRYK
jgi:hypothetical protein